MKELIARPHVILSVENPAHPESAKRKINHDIAVRSLGILGGGKVVEIQGHYNKPERSILISNPSETQLKFARYLADVTGQESHIESDGHSHKMYFHKGPDAGKVLRGTGTTFHDYEPENFYSKLPDGTTFTHNLQESANEEKVEKAENDPIDFSEAPGGEEPKNLTVKGHPVAPNQNIKYNTRSILDPEKGVLHTPKGSFNLYTPHHTDSDYQKILNQPDIQQIHQNAMKNWMHLNALHRQGKKIPDSLIAHANTFSILSANTPVPQQELSYSRLVDTMKRQGIDPRSKEFSEQFKQGGEGRKAWKESDSPIDLPQHSRPYWERIRPIITQTEHSEMTGRKPGDIVALGTLDAFSDRLARYPAAHDYLRQLVNTHGADSRAMVSQMMADKSNPKLPKDHPMKSGIGLGSKTSRYAASMMGGGNTVVPDTHFVRHMFGLDSNTDSNTILYLKNTLWNPKNHGLLNNLDEYYHKNHPAVKFVQDKYFGGKEDPNSIFPAFWLHWLTIAPHEKSIGIGKPYAAKNLTDHTPLWDTASEVLNRHGLGKIMKKSEENVPKHVRTAAAMSELEQKVGIVPAQMIYYAYLVPYLLQKESDGSLSEINELARKNANQIQSRHQTDRPFEMQKTGDAIGEDFEEMEKKKKSKPFHGYNPKRHSRTGGLSDSYRKKVNRETGSNLKRPVTGKVKAGSKAAKRRKSFCARMSGVPGPTSKEGKLTPKGAALKRWKCSKSENLEKARFESKLPAEQKRDIRRKRREATIEPQPVNELYRPHLGSAIEYPPRGSGESLAGISEVGAKVREQKARLHPETRHIWEQMTEETIPPHVAASPKKINEFAAQQALESAKDKIRDVLINRFRIKEKKPDLEPKIPGPEHIENTQIIDPNLVASENKKSTLKKAPIVAEQSPHFAETQISEHSFDENRHVNLHSEKIGKNLSYHRYGEKNSGNTIHTLSRGNPDSPISILVVRPHEKKYGEEKMPVASQSATHPDYQGQGMGTMLKEFAAQHHGGLQSDEIISPGEHKSWEKLKGRGMKVRMAPTTENSETDEKAAQARHSVSPKKTGMAKMSRPRVSFPHLGIGHEEHNVKTIATPRQKEMLVREVINEVSPLAGRMEYTMRSPGVRPLHTALSPKKINGMIMKPANPKSSRSKGAKNTAFVFTGKYFPKQTEAGPWGPEPTDEKELATYRSKKLYSSIQHEAAHLVFSRVGNLHGDEARKAVVNHLMEHAFPDVEHRNLIFNYTKIRGYSPKNEHFGEEMVNVVRDILVHPGIRHSFQQFLSKQAVPMDARKTINDLKSGWQKFYNRSQEITHEDVQNLVNKKGT